MAVLENNLPGKFEFIASEKKTSLKLHITLIGLENPFFKFDIYGLLSDCPYKIFSDSAHLYL